jgi:hypothetical protein
VKEKRKSVEFFQSLISAPIGEMLPPAAKRATEEAGGSGPIEARPGAAFRVTVRGQDRRSITAARWHKMLKASLRTTAAFVGSGISWRELANVEGDHDPTA